MLDCSVIILNYNSSDYTLSCVQSVLNSTSSDIKYELIIVDNNSSPTEQKKLSELDKVENCRIIFSKKNLGFANGHMLGHQFTAPAKYLLFLNNDCELKTKCLDILTKWMDENPDSGLCTAQMFNSANKHIHSFTHFQTLGKMIFGVGLLRLFSPSRYPKRHAIYSEPLEVDTIAGSFMFIRSDIFNVIGGFDPYYFLYCEEEDLSRRVWHTGKKVFLIPEAEFIHHEGKSTKRSYEINREYYISLMHYQRKFYPFLTRFVLRILYSFKVGKKFYKDLSYLKLGFFILCGASSAKSLKYYQQIGNQ